MKFKATEWRRSTVAALVVAVALGLGISFGWIEARRAAAAQSLRALPDAGAEDAYVCPMHPGIVDHQPGSCPICGMALVRHAAHFHGGEPDALRADDAALANLGIGLATAHRSAVALELRVFGTVVPDETALTSVHPKFDGWLRSVRLHVVGEHVRRGQVVYEIYSPELVMKQREYFKFLARRRQVLQAVGDVSQQENEYVMDLLRESQKEREAFLRLDLGIETVRQLEDSGMPIEVVPVLAPRDGIVTQLAAREGSYVSPAAPVYTIADSSTVWIDVALYPGLLESVQAGDAVTVTPPGAAPIEARLDFVNPMAEGGRGRARVVLRPAGGVAAAGLHLGAAVEVSIHARAHEALVLPSSAVARTGHGSFVMLARPQGRFLPVEVRAGPDSGETVEVLGGLREGAQVAGNAQFLLDAAASIIDTRQRREPAPAPATAPAM